jgi:hypothetical protein
MSKEKVDGTKLSEVSPEVLTAERDEQKKGKSNRGFASMDPEKVREIAGMGGKAAHAAGKAHTFSSEEAREAGRKGGKSVARDRAFMAEIGRRGGLSKGRKKKP